MTQGWTTVFTGPIAEAGVVRARLEAQGIPVYVPNESMGPLAPLGDLGVELTLDPQVQVPASAVEAARACLADKGEDVEPKPGEEVLPDGFFDAEPGPEVDRQLLARVKTLSRCILWGAVFPLGFPFALWNLPEYLELSRRLGVRPPNHRITIAAACLSPLNMLGILVPILMDRAGRAG